MKKIISLLLALTMLLTLAACGGNNNETTPGGNQPAETQVTPGTAEQTEPQTQEPVASGEITEELLRSLPETPASDFTYEWSTKYEGIRVVEYLGSEDVVVIPAVIEGGPVVEVAGYCFANDSTVKGVVIPNTVIEIRELFINNQCVELVIAEGVQTFGYNCFLNCASLKTVIMDDNAKRMEGLCFGSCPNLVELHIPATLTEMDAEAEAAAFAACDKLTIYGEAGSFIETVANEQGIPFVAE